MAARRTSSEPLQSAIPVESEPDVRQSQLIQKCVREFLSHVESGEPAAAYGASSTASCLPSACFFASSSSDSFNGSSSSSAPVIHAHVQLAAVDESRVDSGDAECLLTLDVSLLFTGLDPANLAAARRCPNFDAWLVAIKDELRQLEKLNVWTIVEAPPPGTNIVGCRYVFKTKLNADGTFNKLKVRLVAQGYSQVAGVDFNEVYAPTSRYATIRTILALAAASASSAFQLDVKAAYVNAELSDTIYMQPSPYLDVAT